MNGKKRSLLTELKAGTPSIWVDWGFCCAGNNTEMILLSKKESLSFRATYWNIYKYNDCRLRFASKSRVGISTKQDWPRVDHSWSSKTASWGCFTLFYLLWHMFEFSMTKRFKKGRERTGMQGLEMANIDCLLKNSALKSRETRS